MWTLLMAAIGIAFICLKEEFYEPMYLSDSLILSNRIFRLIRFKYNSRNWDLYSGCCIIRRIASCKNDNYDTARYSHSNRRIL